MAHHKKKYTFEDPEDSYWNESGSNNSSLFEYLPSKQWAARAAVDNLFDNVDDGQKASNKVNSPGLEPGTSGVLASTSPKLREKIVNEFINNKVVGLKIDHVSPPRGGAPSIISECSASSLPSDAHRLDLDYSRLRAEHRKLQRHLETVRHERFRALDVKEAAYRLLKNEPVSLEFYRSKAEKLNLLDAAINVIDGNVIQRVLLFLKQTLSDNIFREVLLTRKEAADEYISYLTQIRDYPELVNTLFALGRNADAAMVEFSVALKHKVNDQKIQALRKCTMSAFSDPLLSSESGIVSEYISLLERQQPIESMDSSSNNKIFQQFPKNRSLVGCSSVATLYYCCLYHYDLPQNSLASPLNLKDFLRLSEKEFVWTAISALVRQSRWPDIERVLQPKTLMGALQSRGIVNGKLVCPFSWQNLLLILHNNTSQPPKDLCGRILRAVPDQELRISLAEKYSVTEIIIESLVAQRDRLKLSKFAATLIPHTPEAYKAAAALNNSSTKWKN